MYFNDYATLVQQQGMLQDHVRTSIYQFAVYENKEDFRGKRVLDVGAGTGILSFFAAKAGASHVYAVEASGMALKAEKLAAGNGLQDVVTVLNKRVEDVTLDEKVDLLISEPLGIALVNERMIESYIVARDTLLKPGGKMYPDHAVLHAAPFCDEALYNEQLQKSHFWAARDFYGIDLAAVQEDAHSFYFSQPVVGHVPPHTLLADSCRKDFDFNTMSLEAIQRYTMQVGACSLHALCGLQCVLQPCVCCKPCVCCTPAAPLALHPLRRTPRAATCRSSTAWPPSASCTGWRSGSTAASPARSARSSSVPRRTRRSRTGTRCAACCARRCPWGRGTR